MQPDLDDLPFHDPDWPPAPVAEREPKPCRHPKYERLRPLGDLPEECGACGHTFDPIASRRGRNNGKRGRSDELVVANLLGGRKIGPLGYSYDVEVPGYLRAQAKQLDRWPSLSKVISWLDAIPIGDHLRAVTLADTPGAGRRTRRLIVFDLDEWARWHGRKP